MLELQPLQQLAVKVKKQSVCVKRKDRKIPEQAEVSIHLRFNMYKLTILQLPPYFPNRPRFVLLYSTVFLIRIVMEVGFVSAA